MFFCYILTRWSICPFLLIAQRSWIISCHLTQTIHQSATLQTATLKLMTSASQVIKNTFRLFACTCHWFAGQVVNRWTWSMFHIYILRTTRPLLVHGFLTLSASLSDPARNQHQIFSVLFIMPCLSMQKMLFLFIICISICFIWHHIKALFDET